MYGIYGWSSIWILVILTGPYWLRRVNQYTFHFKGGHYASLMRLLRKIHKPLGLLVSFVALAHGLSIFGKLPFHSGTIAFSVIVGTALFGLFFFLAKKKPLLLLHKTLALLTAVFVAFHLIL